MLPDLDPSKSKFTLENAYVLVRASQAAYAEDEQEYHDRLAEIGIDRNDQEPFASGVDACFVGWTSDFIILSIRGTVRDVPSWLSNLYGVAARTSPNYYGKVHPGFEAGLDALWDEFYPLLETQLAMKRRPVFVTGHSRGGALATLAAQWLHYMGIAPKAVYTYGAPRVGNGAFANKYDVPHHYRVENDRDIVPHLPLAPYSHVGQRCWLDTEGKLTEVVAVETPTPAVIPAAIEDAESGMLDQGSVVAHGAVGNLGFLAPEFVEDHRDTEYAYWLWHQLPDAARADAGTSQYR